MGRICPILNHPLNDGVLVEDKALVSFIQKRNVDFLAHEYVCRSCKWEVTKLYNKKLKRALERHKSLDYHDKSVSTLKTSRDSASSAASPTSEHSIPSNEAQRKLLKVGNITQNGKGSSISETSSNTKVDNANSSTISAAIFAVRDNSVEILTSYNNENFTLQENQKNLANVAQTTLENIHKNITIRKRTIRDFMSPKRQKPNEAAVVVEPQEKAKVIFQTAVPAALVSEVNNVNDSDAIRKVSAEPTTSKAAAASNLNSSILNRYTKATDTVTAVMQDKSKTISKTASPVKKKDLNRHVAFDKELDKNDDNVIRRLSQEPTTSKAAADANKNLNKRRIPTMTDSSDDEDDRALSLNAYNGTRLPHIQPVPPKRKPQPDKPGPIGHDIMDEYIRDITGG